MNQTQAFGHLFEAVKADSSRILQQTICYDKLGQGSLSVPWGYNVHVYDSIQFPRELESPQHTFMHWRKTLTYQFMFNTRNVSRNPCLRPVVLFLESVGNGYKGITTTYIRETWASCQLRKSALQALQQIRVLSPKSQLNWKQVCELLQPSIYFKF